MPGSMGAALTFVVSIAICFKAAVLVIFINEQCPNPCVCADTAAASPDRCKMIPLYLKVPLIATHLFIYFLGPAAMYVFYHRAVVLQRCGATSPFKAVLGFGFIMVAICGEIAWHVGQRWFYHEDYDILNFVFYVFLTLGTSQWALGMRNSDSIELPEQDKSANYSKSGIADIILILSTPVAAVTYALAAYRSYHHHSGSKVPIYVVLSMQYAILSWRLYKLLNDNMRVFFFPFFSVGMNLFFIFLLNTYQASTILNPLFHLCHDAFGTLLGILIITHLVWNVTSEGKATKVKPS